jgi:hypothetical protein
VSQQLQILPDYELAHARGKLPRQLYKVGDLVLCWSQTYAYAGTVESYGWERVAGGTWPMYRVRIAPHCAPLYTPDRMLRCLSDSNLDHGSYEVSKVLISPAHPQGEILCFGHLDQAGGWDLERRPDHKVLSHMPRVDVPALRCERCRAERRSA